MTAAKQRFKERIHYVEVLIRQAHGEHLANVLGDRVAVLAVGGFGRGELFPHSDIDVLLIADKLPEAAAERDALSFFQRALWDGGLRLSHSLRLVEECCQLDENDIERTVALLDRRFLVGNANLWERLEQKFPKFLTGKQGALDRHLCRLASQRHQKFNHTIYHLEPDIKETCGGIRDLHLLHWLREESTELEGAREFLFDLRFALHDRAGRDRNQLTFEEQDEIAKLKSGNPDELMREYYRCARAIYRAAGRAVEKHEGPASGLLDTFRDWRTRLSNADFTVSRDRVLFRGTPDAAAMMRVFPFIARHGIRLSADAEARVAAAAASLAQAPAGWAYWNDLLSQPHAAKALRAMQETLVLDEMLPEWKRIECLVARDFYHRYTVDEHTLVTLDALEGLRYATEPAHRRFFELYSEAEGLSLLRLALLLHDIGKGSGEDHSTVSVRLAQEILARWQVPQGQRRVVLFLIEHHLDLSTLMSSRDLGDPRVAEEAAHRVETVEQLKLLTLLTYADISAVHPGAMTPWRAEQLWRAYRTVRQELTRELRTELITAPPSDRPEIKEWLDGFPTRYLRTHSFAEIERHVKLAEQARVLGTVVSLERRDGGWEALVVTPDRPGLFAAIAGAIATFGMNIVKAEAFANQAGLVLDTFVFQDPLRTLELNPGEVETVRKRIAEAAAGKIDVGKMLKSRPRKKAPVKLEPVVAVDNRATEAATLIEVVAEDRPGLLHDMAAEISAMGCSIDVVLIDTEAHKALDVFYVTREGNPLADEMAGELRDRIKAMCGS
ncbi:MAG: HD domain-containing protein [Bryobacteraceae bacterium]|nr:HD domain-containing protein [Bryobacteraceae bacterium]